MHDEFENILNQVTPAPVLVDIGASGEPPRKWARLSEKSIYVGFDADARDIHTGPLAGFREARIVNKAAVAEEGRNRVEFFLTSSPHCSSTLPPDNESLADYLFSDLFQVKDKVEADGVTLNQALADLNLDRLDWFKTDSQGTDLRLFRSLAPELINSVLAVDIEPGLIDAYKGEDLYVAAHQYLVESGFWLSRLDVKGSVRMRRATLDRIKSDGGGLADALVKRNVRRSPGWVNATYLAGIDRLIRSRAGRREYLLLWIFAMIDEQYGFAADVAYHFADAFHGDEAGELMKGAAVGMITDPPGAARPRRHFLRRATDRVLNLLGV